MSRLQYPTDLTDAQWVRIAEFVPEPGSGGRPASVDRRELVNAMLYVVSEGITWRALPHDFPKWQTVYHYFRRWSDAGIWDRILNDLRATPRNAVDQHVDDLEATPALVGDLAELDGSHGIEDDGVAPAAQRRPARQKPVADADDVLSEPARRSALSSIRGKLNNDRSRRLQRIADMVRESLQEAIIEGQLEAGFRLREEEVAREFGVSRTPVREALQQLAATGLIEMSPHLGAVVSQLTMEDVLSLYLVRESLEGLAARLAAERATPVQRAELYLIMEDMEAMAKAGNPAKFATLNLRFHAAISRAAHNRYAEHFITQIEHAVRRSGQTTFTVPGRIESTIAEHRAIIDAIMAKDPERAEQLMIQHMREARELRLRMIEADRARRHVEE